MMRRIRVELLKIRTTRLGCGLLATAAAITEVLAGLNATRGDPVSTASGLTAQVSVGVWAACAGAVFGLAGGVLATGTGLIFLAARGQHVTIGAPAVARDLAGYALAAALLAAAGSAVGSLVRSQLAAVAGVPLPFGAAAALVAGVAVLIAALAARTTVRRDVS